MPSRQTVRPILTVRWPRFALAKRCNFVRGGAVRFDWMSLNFGPWISPVTTSSGNKRIAAPQNKSRYFLEPWTLDPKLSIQVLEPKPWFHLHSNQPSNLHPNLETLKSSFKPSGQPLNLQTNLQLCKVTFNLQTNLRTFKQVFNPLNQHSNLQTNPQTYKPSFKATSMYAAWFARAPDWLGSAKFPRRIQPHFVQCAL